MKGAEKPYGAWDGENGDVFHHRGFGGLVHENVVGHDRDMGDAGMGSGDAGVRDGPALGRLRTSQ